MVMSSENLEYTRIKNINTTIIFDEVTGKSTTEHNPDLPQLPDHPYRILTVGGSGSGKTNVLFNLINHLPDINTIFLYAKNPYELKYQYLIKKREEVGLRHFKNPKAFIKYSNEIKDVYNGII